MTHHNFALVLLHHCLDTQVPWFILASPCAVSIARCFPAPSQHDPISYPDSGLSVDHDASTNTPVPQSFFLLPPRSLQKTCSMTPEAFRAHCQNRWKLLDVPHTVTTVPREHCGATRQMAKPLSSDLPWSQLHFLMYFLGATNISNWNPLDSSHVISG